MAALPGRFNDGRSAASRTVTVRPSPAGLDIRGEDGLMVAFWRIADLRADGEMPGGRGVRLRCVADPDARLSLEQAEFIRPLLPARQNRRPWMAVLAAGAAALAVVLALWLGIPAGARWLAAAVPTTWEQRWGDALANGLEGRWGSCRQPAGSAALHLLSDRLAAPLAAELRPRRVVVVRQADANAIALPGGTVMVFSGLLAAAGGPDELAGVLAHEFTHLRLRHPTAALIRAAGVGLTVTLVTGDSSGVLAGGAAMALAGAYSRDDEAAADAGAVALLDQAGLDAGGLAAFFRRIAALHAAPPLWLSTHPDPMARAQAVEKAGARPGPPALTADQWAALRGICG